MRLIELDLMKHGMSVNLYRNAASHCLSAVTKADSFLRLSILRTSSEAVNALECLISDKLQSYVDLTGKDQGSGRRTSSESNPSTHSSGDCIPSTSDAASHHQRKDSWHSVIGDLDSMLPFAVTREFLRNSGVGRKLSQLKDCANGEVQDKAEQVITAWKKRLKNSQ